MAVEEHRIRTDGEADFEDAVGLAAAVVNLARGQQVGEVETLLRRRTGRGRVDVELAGRLVRDQDGVVHSAEVAAFRLDGRRGRLGGLLIRGDVEDERGRDLVRVRIVERIHVHRLALARSGEHPCEHYHTRKEKVGILSHKHKI